MGKIVTIKKENCLGSVWLRDSHDENWGHVNPKSGQLQAWACERRCEKLLALHLKKSTGQWNKQKAVAAACAKVFRKEKRKEMSLGKSWPRSYKMQYWSTGDGMNEKQDAHHIHKTTNQEAATIPDEITVPQSLVRELMTTYVSPQPDLNL